MTPTQPWTTVQDTDAPASTLHVSQQASPSRDMAAEKKKKRTAALLAATGILFMFLGLSPFLFGDDGGKTANIMLDDVEITGEGAPTDGLTTTRSRNPVTIDLGAEEEVMAEEPVIVDIDPVEKDAIVSEEAPVALQEDPVLASEEEEDVTSSFTEDTAVSVHTELVDFPSVDDNTGDSPVLNAIASVDAGDETEKDDSVEILRSGEKTSTALHAAAGATPDTGAPILPFLGASLIGAALLRLRRRA